jgi:hypothetical protein
MNQSIVKLERSVLKPENRAVKMKMRQQEEEITAHQEIIITIEDNNERLYRQMRMLMQRNNELLDVISEMQTEIDKLKNEKLLLVSKNDEKDLGNGKYMRNGVMVVKDEGNTDFNFVQMRVSRLSDKRKQQRPTLEAQTKMLLELYNHTGEGMTTDELFAKSELTRVTGYRYARFFKQRGFLQFIGSHQNGRYELTKQGRLFVEGRL